MTLKEADIGEEERLAIVKAMGTLQWPLLEAVKRLERRMYWFGGTLTLVILSLPDQFLLNLLKDMLK